MLGSVDDAEDLVQETYLRPGGPYGGFEGRSSVAGLALPDRHQCLPDCPPEPWTGAHCPPALGGPRPVDPEGPAGSRPGSEVRWLQPIPDGAGGPPASR